LVPLSLGVLAAERDEFCQRGFLAQGEPRARLVGHVARQAMDPDQTGMMPRRKVTTSVSVQGSYLAGSHGLAMDGGGVGPDKSLCGVVAATLAVMTLPTAATYGSAARFC
jgi:hypothetical protein